MSPWVRLAGARWVSLVLTNCGHGFHCEGQLFPQSGDPPPPALGPHSTHPPSSVSDPPQSGICTGSTPVLMHQQSPPTHNARRALYSLSSTFYSRLLIRPSQQPQEAGCGDAVATTYLITDQSSGRFADSLKATLTNNGGRAEPKPPGLYRPAECTPACLQWSGHRGRSTAPHIGELG